LKINGIDHVGIAVKSIDEARVFYEKGLNLKVGGFEEIPERSLNVAFFNTGNSRIELIESTSPNSAIAKYLDKNGQGIHHICIEVENIIDSLNNLKSEGYRLIDSEPKKGAGGSLVAFVHPISADGILIELKQIVK